MPRKPVPGYEVLYEVDSDGSVWRIGAPRGRPLTPVKVGRYHRVVLSRNDVQKRFFVHQLVLLAFEGPCPEGEQSRRRNGDSIDNRLENLCYGTAQENIDDRERHGRTRRGERHGNAVLTEEQARAIKTATSGVYKLGRSYGVSRHTVDAIRGHRNWKHV